MKVTFRKSEEWKLYYHPDNFLTSDAIKCIGQRFWPKLNDISHHQYQYEDLIKELQSVGIVTAGRLRAQVAQHYDAVIAYDSRNQKGWYNHVGLFRVMINSIKDRTMIASIKE